MEPACHMRSLRVVYHLAEAASPTLTTAITSQYSTYPPIMDERLNRPEPTQVNYLPGVATKVLAIPDIRWLSQPYAPLGTIGASNLPTVVTQFEHVSFEHESNALSTWPPGGVVGSLSLRLLSYNSNA